MVVLAGRATATTEDPLRRIALAVGREDHGHGGPDRAVDDVESRRAAIPARSGDILRDTELLNENRVLELVDFDAVSVHQTRHHRHSIGEPSVRGWRARATVVAEDHLVHVGRVVAARIRSRNDADARAHPQTTFGDPVAIAELCECTSDGVYEPIGNVRRSHGTTVREARDPHGAVLSKLDVDASEGALVPRDVFRQRVEHTRHGTHLGGSL